jgi:hypothetical protein
MTEGFHSGNRHQVREEPAEYPAGPRNLFRRRLAVSSARAQRYAAIHHDALERRRSRLTGPCPKLIKRLRRRSSLLTLFVFVPLFVVFWFSQGQFWFSRRWLIAFSSALVIVTLGNILMVIVAELRLKRRVIAADKRICPTCGYSLLGHNAEGTCPECGQAFTPASLEAAWRDIRWYV